MEKSRTLLVGALWMLGASLGISVLVALVRVASPFVPIVEIIFLQSVIPLVVVAPVVIAKGWQTEHPWWQIVCGVAGVLGYLFFFWPLLYAPMVGVVLATNTAPLWIPLIGLVLFQKHLKWLTWVGIVIGFVGIVVILHPGLAGFHLATSSGLVTGLMIGTLLVAMRVFANKDGPYLTLFYVALIASLTTLPFAAASWKSPPTWVWLALVGCGVVNAFLQIARVKSLQKGAVAIMGTIYFLTVLFTGIIGWIFWGEVPNWWFYVGAVLVIGGGTWTIVSARR